MKPGLRVPAHLCQEFLGTIDLGPSKLNSSLGILGIFQCTKPIRNLASGLEISWEAFLNSPTELHLSPYFLQDVFSFTPFLRV